MLARSAAPPTRSGWSFEPKWDGFRAILRTGKGYCVCSRRGWPMAELLPEFRALPVRGMVDGELVAFGTDGFPSFHRLCARMLNRDRSVPVALILFDVVAESEAHRSGRRLRLS